MPTAIGPTNLVFDFALKGGSWANLNAYKIILNWQPFMSRVYNAVQSVREIDFSTPKVNTITKYM